MSGFPGLGTIVNTAAVLIGGIAGVLVGRRFSERMQKIAMQGLGLCTIIIGVGMGIKMENALVVISSMVIGGLMGEWLQIEERLERLGSWLKERTKSREGTFVDGFVGASLVYCVGPLTILGSIADGLNRNPDLLFTKAMLDGVYSIAFAASVGIGVAFSSITVLTFQGGLVIASLFLGNFLDPSMVAEMTATGGLLIIGIGINILGIKKIKVGNLLPAIFVALVLAGIAKKFV
ncbi:MAG: DUF554 domain-containing protein [bacterium]